MAKKMRDTETRPTTPRLEVLRLEQLVPHPDQAKYFRRYGAFEYDTLKKDIEANGLKTRIEVMPPRNAAGFAAHTILTGHTRRTILLELGHTEAGCAQKQGRERPE